MNQMQNLNQETVRNKDTILIQMRYPVMENIGQPRACPLVKDMTPAQEVNQGAGGNKNMDLAQVVLQDTDNMGLDQVNLLALGHKVLA